VASPLGVDDDVISDLPVIDGTFLSQLDADLDPQVRDAIRRLVDGCRDKPNTGVCAFGNYI
jgi:hypothetical protein